MEVARQIMQDEAKTKPGVSELILAHYNTKNPHFAYCVGGLRRLSVDPKDARARKMLLSKGPKYFSKNQSFIYSCMKHLPVDLFLDIGVNYGECLVSAPLFSKVPTRGFEANPKLIPYLRKTLKMNDDLKNVEVVPMAMSAEAGGEISFFVSEKWSGKSSVVPGVSGSNAVKITVPTTTVDAQVKDLTDLELLLIKLDVEGHEPSVLAGAKEATKTIPNIIVLMEFDTVFLRKTGIHIKDFFEDVSKDFSVWLFSMRGIHPIRTFEDLENRFKGKTEMHGDLVLVKTDIPGIQESFQNNIIAKYTGRVTEPSL